MSWVSTRGAKRATAKRAIAVVAGALGLALFVASAGLLVELLVPEFGLDVDRFVSPGPFLALVAVVGASAGWHVLARVLNAPARTTRLDLVAGSAVFWIVLHVSLTAFGNLLGAGSWGRYLTESPTTRVAVANGVFYLALLVVSAFATYRAAQGYRHGGVVDRA